MNTKKIFLSGLTAFSGLCALPSEATCIPGTWNNAIINFTLPNQILVQRDLPVGALIYNFVVNLQAGSWVSSCSPPGTLNSGYRNGWVPNANRIVQTNIPGIGLKMRYQVTNDGPSDAISDWRFDNVTGAVGPGGPPIMSMEFYKTGPVTAGTMPTGIYAGIAVQNQFWIFSFANTGGGNFIPVACSVTNTAIQVPMGNVRPNEFSGPGSSAGEKDFNVPLNCDAGTRVNITLEGTADSSGVAGVLALNPSSTATVAKGVGLQLLRSNAPVRLGTPIAVGTVASAGPYTIPLVARYYQTAPTIVGGQANSTATFTMTYN